MSRSPNRDVATILAEQEAKTEALRQRKALADAKGSKVLAPLFDQINGCNKDLQTNSVLLGNGPGSCATKRMSHSLWIAVIDAQEHLATLEGAHTRAVKEYFQAAIADLSARIANGEKVTTAMVKGAIEGAPAAPEDIANAKEVVEVAQADRSAHTVAKKARKRSASAEG